MVQKTVIEYETNIELSRGLIIVSQSLNEVNNLMSTPLLACLGLESESG